MLRGKDIKIRNRRGCNRYATDTNPVSKKKMILSRTTTATAADPPFHTHTVDRGAHLVAARQDRNVLKSRWSTGRAQALPSPAMWASDCPCSVRRGRGWASLFLLLVPFVLISRVRRRKKKEDKWKLAHTKRLIDFRNRYGVIVRNQSLRGHVLCHSEHGSLSMPSLACVTFICDSMIQ